MKQNIERQARHSSNTNVICRFFKGWSTKRKTRKFEREFDKYYTGLLMGDLYDAKVRLLTKMKNEKHLWLKKYLENKLSVSRQIDEVLSNGI